MKCSFLSAENFLLMSLTGGCLAFEISLWSFSKLFMFLSAFPVFMRTFHIQENFLFPCVFPTSMSISCFYEHIPFSGIIPVSMCISCFHVYFLTTVRSPPRKIRLLVWICQNKLFPLRARFLSSFVSNKGTKAQNITMIQHQKCISVWERGWFSIKIMHNPLIHAEILLTIFWHSYLSLQNDDEICNIDTENMIERCLDVEKSQFLNFPHAK